MLSTKEISNIHREKECAGSFSLLSIDVETVANVNIKVHETESHTSTCCVTVSLEQKRLCAPKADEINHGERTDRIEIEFTKDHIQQSPCELCIPNSADLHLGSFEGLHLFSQFVLQRSEPSLLVPQFVYANRQFRLYNRCFDNINIFANGLEEGRS